MLLIKNGKINTITKGIIDNGFIAIAKGNILYVGDNEEDAIQSFGGNEYKEIDASGGYVMPGLIDAHCHIGMWEDAMGFEGADGNEMTDPVTPHLRAIDGINHADKCFIEAREAGVTTVVTGPGSANTIGGQFVALKTAGRYVDEMILKEPVAIKCAFGENPNTVYNRKQKTPMTRMATAALIRETLQKAIEYKERIEKHAHDPEKNAPDFNMKLHTILKLTNKELHLKAHAHRADDILTAIRIAEEFDIDYTLDHCTEGHLIKDVLKEKKSKVIVGPLLIDRSKPELKNLDIKAPGILAKAGIEVAIMTDHPVIPVQYLLLSAVMAHKEGMPEEDALKAITINAARFNYIDERVGSLEAGKDADIVIFDKHPLDCSAKVKYTLISGTVVYNKADA